jgi:hypothetical protein
MSEQSITSQAKQSTLTIIAKVRPKWVELLFLLLLGVGLTYQVALAFSYPRLSGLFPLIVGVPTLGLIAYITVTDVLRGSEAESKDGSELEDRFLLLQGVAWTLLLLALVYVIGLVIGAAVFLVAYYRTKGTSAWKLAMLTGIFLLFAIVVFQIVLQIPLYEGLLGLPQTVPI